MNKLPLFSKGKSGGINFSRSNDNHRQISLIGFSLFIFLFFLVLVLRLFQLTIVKGDYYQRLAENNRIREIVIEPQRGRILDRKGFVIAQNVESDVDNSSDRILSRRIYQSPEAIAHVVGYRQLADQEDIKNDSCINKLKAGDKVGKKGVEKLFDCELRGKPGKKLVEVDAKGKYLRTITVIPPVNGKDIQLSIDLELQKQTYELIKGKKAAVVGIKPKTGEILLLASSPSFSPQDFEDANSENISKYFNDKDKPMFSRATEGTYPPGSLFKLVVATAALEEKAVDGNTVFEDTGKIKAGPIEFGNWYFLQYGKVEGPVDIVKAIQRSNDIYFYKAGEAVGEKKIKLWAEKFGYGKLTNFGLDESEGTIPSGFWKEEKLKEHWYLGDTYNFSIGQGYMLATPLQTAMMTTVFANGGNFCQPKLLRSDAISDPVLQKQYGLPLCQKMPISEKTFGLIQEGMRKACTTGGTGWPLFQFGISQSQPDQSKPNETNRNQSKNSLELVPTNSKLISTNSAQFQPIQTSCKTGTAEFQSSSGTPHAWFTVYAPTENPEIVLSVLLEEGGQGSDVAGPVARDILKAYFERNE